MRVECEIQYDEVEGAHGTIDGVRAVCTECGYETESAGTTERSVKRCLALMRQECPQKDENYYVNEDDEEDDGY